MSKLYFKQKYKNRLRPIKILKTPPEHMLKFKGDKEAKEFGLPNPIFPSDHVRLESVFQLK